MKTFEDWFNKVPYPYLKRRPGKKVIIGDNLASHLSYNVIRKCEKNDIHFILFPPNATQYIQPLDVAVFHSFKLAWRKVLKEWKKNPSKKNGPFKDNFPRLLKETVTSIVNTMGSNLRAGFKSCGLVPFDPERVLKKLPRKDLETSVDSNESGVVLQDKLIDYSKKRGSRQVRPVIVVAAKKLTLPQVNQCEEVTFLKKIKLKQGAKKIAKTWLKEMKMSQILMIFL
jgi:hypothetical protein